MKLDRLTVWQLARTAAVALVLAGIGLGCGGASGPPEPIPVDQVAGAVQNTFEGASAEARTLADGVASAIQQKDSVRAFVQLQTLAGRQDLTPEQRDTTARSLMSVSEQLRAAADAGDQRAQEMLQMHQAHK